MKKRDEIAYEEATRDPIFLLQCARLVITDHSKIEVDDEGTPLDPETKDPLSNKEIMDAEAGHLEWDTESVWATREEATTFLERTKYNFRAGGRVYCVCAEGTMAGILKASDHAWVDAKEAV